ncbi:hypothetical protein PFB06_02915 [Lactiplantibacillus plantarum]|nr:hypothetical protein [Lactiplantibacillus plantarum]MDA3610699.1 hypothetical protein [Lactiplantibacillus plantarum]WGI30376.1 hypothetical protein QCN25_15075 [Lactiplantibacillus plantarum]
MPNRSVIYQWVNRYTSGKPLRANRRASPNEKR